MYGEDYALNNFYSSFKMIADDILVTNASDNEFRKEINSTFSDPSHSFSFQIINIQINYIIFK